MNRDNLLDIYEETWAKTVAWLTGPMSIRDLEPLFKFTRVSPEKAMFPMLLLKSVVMVRVATQIWRQTRHRSKEIAAVAGALGANAGLRRAIANWKTLQLHSQRSRTQTGARQRRHVLRVLETGFWVMAAGVFGYCSFVYASSAVHQAQRKDLFNSRKAEDASARLGTNSSATTEPSSSKQERKDGRLLGFLDIPKIGLSSVVEEGAAPSILFRGVGHLSGTALPGQRGNVGLAGHLDSYFGELSKLRIGDILTFRSMTKTYDYSIVSTNVADASEAKAPPQSNEPTLTLVSYFSSNKQVKAKQLVVVARAFSNSDYASP